MVGVPLASVTGKGPGKKNEDPIGAGKMHCAIVAGTVSGLGRAGLG